MRLLTSADLCDGCLADFERYQETTRVWYVAGENGCRGVKGDHFVDDWGSAAKRRVVAALRRCLADGGVVVGAMEAERLVGFASVRAEPLGRQGRYLELDYLHVSRPHRGRGIGRRLFAACCGEARARGAARLYIGAHPSVESQAFYRAVGCVPAAEIVAAVYGREPRDIQLEFVL